MKKFKRPLILAGRGVRASGAIELFRQFVEKYQIPVVTSLLGLDVLPYNYAQRMGFIGIYGNRWANYALGNCDFLLVLGSRMDSRQTGNRELFSENKVIYHVDIDPAELNNNIKGCITINDNLSHFLQETMNENLLFTEIPSRWIEEIRIEREKYPDTDELIDCKGINPNVFIHKLSRASREACAFTADVGSNQMWTAQSLELTRDQLFLTSGGMGAMGYSLPASIGACMTLNKPVVCISGDGGFQINIQELQTIKRNNLPIKMVVLNNHCLGMIRQFQDAYFDSRYQSTVWDYSAPDFSRIANAYGIDSYCINREQELNHGLGLLWENPNEPFLLEVEIDVKTNISPKVMWGDPLTKMS